MKLTYASPVKPGTMLHMDYHSGRFVSVVDCEPNFDLPWTDSLFFTATLDFATAKELTSLAQPKEPRSIVEHRALPKHMTPFGLGRFTRPYPGMRHG